MADISQMNVNGTTYDIKDTVARASGVPSGGNTNQVLAKNSNSDYDLKWVNQSGGGGVGTVVNLTTTTPSFHNKTVTLTGTYATYSAVFDNTGHASVNVYYVGTYDIACEGFHNSVNVTAMGLVLTQGIDEDYCTVNLSSSDSNLEGATCTIYFGDPTDDDVRQVTVVDSTLAFSFRATQIGSYTMETTYTSNGATVTIPTTFTVTTLEGSMNVTIQSIPLKTFAAATDEEIAQMVQAADAGLIDLYDNCGWRVGQEHSVTLSAMSATGVSESHAQQTVTLVLMNKGGKTLTTPTESGRTTCSFIFGLKDCLKEKGQMNSTQTNVGGWTSSARRTWCNTVFKAAFPSVWQQIIKQFQNKTSAGGNSSTINTDNDYFGLASEIEILGTVTYSFQGEGTQFEWYETAANRIKKTNGAVDVYGYWERSPYPNQLTFCVINSNGKPDAGGASDVCSISPFGCI